MTNDLKAIKPGTLTESISAKEGWKNTEKVVWPVAEGLAIFKKDGLYYLFYSASDFRNKNYAVGFAIS